MFCSNCGAELPEGSRYCSYCGSEVFARQPQQMPHEEPSGQSQQFTVPQGQPIVINVNNVNTNTNTNTNNNVNSAFGGRAVSAKSRMVTLFLCILFGFFGAHNFYAGRMGRGVLYFFTGGVFGLGWIWDIVQILRGKFVDKYGLPIVS